jgi:hypothetical protein
MAKSRTAGALLAAAFFTAAPALAQPPAPLTAEQAIANQKDQLQASMNLDCRREEGEIVVCGRGGPDPNRLPFPDERLPGDRDGLGPTTVGALNAGSTRCSTVGPNQQCGGGLDVFAVGIFLFKLGKHLVDPEK